MRRMATRWCAAISAFTLLLLALACSGERNATGAKPAPPSPPAATAPAAPSPASPTAAPPTAEPPVSTPPAAMAPAEIVRPAAFAGSWYPGDRDALRLAVDGYLNPDASSITTRLPQRPRALIAPHAGYRFSGPTAGYAYRTLRTHPGAPPIRRVIVLGPSHHVAFHGVALPRATRFETPLGTIPIDTALVERLRRDPLFSVRPDAHAHEHSVEMQLPLLQRALAGSGWRLLPLVVGRLSEAEVASVADALRPSLDATTLLIASSDFTHYGPNYGYIPFREKVPENIKKLDMGLYDRVAAHDVAGMFAYKRATGCTVCGFLPIAVVVSALPKDTRVTQLHYDTSGHILDDWTNSVSYMAVAFTGASASPATGVSPATATDPAPLTDAEKSTLLHLARDTVEAWVRQGRLVDPQAGAYTITSRLREKSGVFVTLKEGGRLRGCIGDILPRRPLFIAVRDRAVDAAVHDSRFNPVRPDELDRLHLEISVLTPPKRVPGWRDIVIGRDGVLITKRGHRAVYLPQVAPEQGWDVETTLAHLSRKAGLPMDAWREGMTFETFHAIVFDEPER